MALHSLIIEEIKKQYQDSEREGAKTQRDAESVVLTIDVWLVTVMAMVYQDVTARIV